MVVKKKKDEFVELDVVHKKQKEPQVVARIPKDVKEPEKDKNIGKRIDELKQLTEKIKLEKEDVKTVGKKVLKKILPAPVKTNEPVGDILKTNIDRLYDLVKLKKIIRIRTAARVLKVSYDMVEEWSRVLEDNKMVRLHYPTFGEPIIMLKKPKKKGKKKGNIKIAKKKKPAFFFNIIIIVVFVVILAVVLGIDIPGLQDQSLTTYLIIGAVVIVVLFMAMKFMKRKTSKVLKTKEEPKKDEKTEIKKEVKHDVKKEVKNAERKKDG